MPKYTDPADREREAADSVAAHADELRRIIDAVAVELRDRPIDGLDQMDADAVRALVAWALSKWAREEVGRAVQDAKERLTWQEVADQVNRGVGTLHKLADEVDETA